MAKTVIGLFNDMREAQHIVQALGDDGFRREDIRTLTGPEEASVGTLSAYGVPAAEAGQYTNAVRQGGVVVLVDTPDDRAARAVALMERAPAGDREARPAAEAAPHRAADAARAGDRAGTREGEAGDIKIPVVEETIQVGTRQVPRGGVRLQTRVVERPVEETVRLRDETVRVERRMADRPATEADLAAGRERTVEITETDEEAVVAKEARVVEEVVVRKDVQEQTETVRDTVRRTEVEVEEVGAGRTQAARGFDTYDADFRGHYSASLAGRGHPYERWAPAYRYGYDLAGDPRYAGRDWAALEADARRGWEAQQKGTWEEFKDTIRHAWETVRGRR
jgi:stress response protein YsnF